jgi:hypothetical protein
MARADSRSGKTGTKAASSGKRSAGSRSSGGSSSSSSTKRSKQGRRSAKTRRSTPAKATSKGNGSNKSLPDYSIIEPGQIEEAVDVYVDVPVVEVDEISFEMDDLRAHVAVLAEAGHFVQLNAGAAVRLGKVELEIKGVETQALLEARLHNVTAILGRVLTSLDRNPEILESVGKALGDVGGGAHDLLGDTGDVVKSAGKGAESALQDVGQGAGKGVAGIGRGAQQGVEGLGQGAAQGVEGLGQGAQQGVAGLGQGAQQGLQGVGQGAEQGLQSLAQGGQAPQSGGGR